MVEVEKLEFERIKTFPFPHLMSAKVIESKLKDRFVGEKSNNFINPHFEMMQTGWPVFVRIW